MAASITEGGYDFDFLTDLPEDLTCVLCHFAFKNPVQVEECGHVFCKQCFDNMKDHAESNCAELLCPLDRLKIDVTRVFKEKRDERRVLNLMVKCRNFGDKCDWTGELRQALEHQTLCCKNDTMLNSTLESEFKQLISRMSELEVKVKVHGQKLVEKDTQIINQTNQILNLQRYNTNQDKQILNQNKQIEDQKKQIINLERHNAYQDNKILNQEKQIGDQKKQIENLQQWQTKHQASTPLSMIKPDFENESTYSPICSAFQWKFKPVEVKSNGFVYSPPFYNIMNSHCFQLSVNFDLVDDDFDITLRRYRGKYDHKVNEIYTAKEFDFQIHIFGKNGKLEIVKFNREDDGYECDDYSISKHELIGEGVYASFDNDIVKLTVDGYVHLHCFFNKVDN